MIRVEIANLVEKQGPVSGKFPQTYFGIGRTRKGPGHVPEQFGFQLFAWNGTTVHLNKAFPCRFAVVDGAGDHVLARSGIAQDQHG
jgi:hypothetical protein